MQVASPVEVYASQDPTAAYTFTDWIDLADHPFVEWLIFVSGTAPTSWQWKLQVAAMVVGGVSVDPADGTTPLAATDVEGKDRVLGNGTIRGAELDLLDQDGTVLSTSTRDTYERVGARWVRGAIKRTNGDANSRARVLAMKGT